MLRIYLLSLILAFLASPLKGQIDCEKEIAKHYTESNYGLVLEIIKTCYPDSTYSDNISNLLAKSLHRSGMYKDAKIHCERMVKDSIELPSAHQILGQIYDAEENSPKAIKHYLAIYKMDTTRAPTSKKLAGLYLKGGDKSSGFWYYKKAHHLNPLDISVITSLSEIFIENDQIGIADSLLNMAYQLDSNNVKVLLLSAKVFYMHSEYADAVYNLEKANHFVDFSPYFNKLYGYALLRIDSVDQAIYFLEKALVGERSNREYAHYYLATAYEKKEMQDYAIHHYQKALEEAISNNTSIYFRNLGLIYEEQKQYKEAIQQYKKGLDWNDEGRNDMLWFYLARSCDYYYKDKAIAIRHYSTYMKSKDSNKELKKYAAERIKYLQGIVHMSN